MKKIIIVLSIIFICLIFPINTLAKGYISVSPTSITVEKGKSKNIKITAYNAIGDVTIKSNSTSIAKINMGQWSTGVVEENSTKTVNIKVTGVSIGSTTINIEIDGATFDQEDLSGTTKVVNVNVIEPVVKPVLSSNNKLKSIEVSNYSLEKINENLYTLVVNTDIEEIELNAIAEDSKAKVSGTGKKELKIGDNNFEIIVTSQSGVRNKIIIEVTKKDGYYFEDLEHVLSKTEGESANIIIDSQKKITEEVVNKIKESKKEIEFSYYSNNIVQYSWIINGKNIKEITGFSSSISFETNNKKIKELSNYAEGININFEHNGNLPKGTIVKINTQDKFQNNDILKLYYYNEKNNKLELINEKVKVLDNYVSIELEHCSEYFLTMSNIELLKEEVNISNLDEEKTFDWHIIISIVELIIIICLITFIILNKNKSKPSLNISEIKKENNVQIENKTVQTIQNTIQEANSIENNNIQQVNDNQNTIQ